MVARKLVGQVLYRSEGYPPEGASEFYVDIDSAYLTPYGLKDGDKLYGELQEVRPSQYENQIGEMKGKGITFIVGRGCLSLFISNENFENAFREYGLVKSGFMITAKLQRAEIAGKIIEIYTKRDAWT